MNLKIASREDFLSGLLFVLLGLTAAVIAYHYPLGTPARMGPGMLPFLLGVLLFIIGLGVCLQSLSRNAQRARDSEESAAASPPSGQLWRPLLSVVLGMGTFALLVRPLGLVLAIIALVLIVTQAEKGFPIWLALLLGPVLAVFAVVIFVYGLGLPFRVWF